MYTYSVHGLNVEFPIACPNLPPGQRPADVTIRYGEVPDRLASARAGGVCYQATPGRVLIHLDGIVRLLISRGEEIIVDRASGLDDDSVRHFVSTLALTIVLHQRGSLVLHASAVAVGEGCVAFAGSSGEGKSLLAAALYERGYRVVADKVCAISVSQAGVPQVHPGYPELHLWADALEALHYETKALRRIRPGLQKYALPVASNFATTPLPLSHIYLLEDSRDSRLEFSPLHGGTKLSALLSHTYRREYLEEMGCSAAHFKCCASVAKHTAVRRLERGREFEQLDAAVDALERDWDR